MLKTLEATIEKDGTVHLKEKVKLQSKRKALVTILDDTDSVEDVTLLSEQALANDWNRPEEDEAWQHLH